MFNFNLGLVLFILQLWDYLCYKIECGNELKTDVCLGEETNESMTVRYVKICPSGQYCSDQSFLGCVKKATLVPPGKKCKDNLDCRTGACKNNICTPIKLGEQCNNDNECEEGLICTSDTAICAEKKALDDSCHSWLDCRTGLECAGTTKGSAEDMRCIKMGTAKDGIIAETIIGCHSGYGIDVEDFRVKCVTLYNETPCKMEDDGQYYCTGETDDGGPVLNTSIKLPCRNKWDGTYICLNQRYYPFQSYLEEMNIQLEKLDHDLPAYVDRYSFGLKSLGMKYLEYYRNQYFSGSNDCLKDFYYQYYLSHNFLKVCAQILSLFFLCLI